MANLTIGGLALATSAAAADWIEIETVGGLSRKISKANYIGGTLSGGGTLALGGFTLTVAGNSSINGSFVGSVNGNIAGNIVGGGTITLGGNTLTVTTGGTIALGGNILTVTTGGTIALGGNILTVTTGGTIALGGNILTVTTGGTIALGGFTLTVPASGTAALLGTAQTFTAVNTFSAGIALGNETLSIYDQGTWTPVLVGATVTYTTQTGKYTRLGNVVIFTLQLTIATITGSAVNISISLPATASDLAFAAVRTIGVDLPGTAAGVVAQTNGANLNLYTNEDNAAGQILTLNALAAGDIIFATGAYFA